MKNKVYLTQEGKEEIESLIIGLSNSSSLLERHTSRVLKEILENSEVINFKHTLNNMENTLEYYKQNCEDDYINTPISVLRYISELEESLSEKPTLKELCKDEDLRNEVIELINKFERVTAPNRFEGYGTEQEDIDKFISENI